MAGSFHFSLKSFYVRDAPKEEGHEGGAASDAEYLVWFSLVRFQELRATLSAARRAACHLVVLAAFGAHKHRRPPQPLAVAQCASDCEDGEGAICIRRS